MRDMTRRNFLKAGALGLASLTPLAMTNCTLTGLRSNLEKSIDFGEWQELRFGVYKTDRVSEKKVEKIIGFMAEELEFYKINPTVKYIKTFTRDRYATGEVLDSGIINNPKIDDSCDRNLYLIGRKPFDNLWGILGPGENLAVVDSYTSTQVCLVANYGLSLGQGLKGVGPTSKHEAKHLIGLGEHAFLNTTEMFASNVAVAKNLREINIREGKGDFFPGRCLYTNEIIGTRGDANKRLEKLKDYLLTRRESFKNTRHSRLDK